MGTPFIELLEPSSLTGYDRTKPQDQQPPYIPKTFLDAMSVREAVFVKEQNVPLEFEHDLDDSRSCHWVMYASVNQVVEKEQRDPSTGVVTQPRRSETQSLPIGTMRVVPFPHPPHPRDGDVYLDNVLQERAGVKVVDEVRGDPVPSGGVLSEVEIERQSAAQPFGDDRATALHDGREPYVKLGRLAVVPEFRGRKVSSQLWMAARKWLEGNPNFFNPSVKELGMDQLKVDAAAQIPRWNGLICCHSQAAVVKTYEKWGFQVDEGMGTWYEEGIPHVGMFMRLNVTDLPPAL